MTNLVTQFCDSTCVNGVFKSKTCNCRYGVLIGGRVDVCVVVEVMVVCGWWWRWGGVRWWWRRGASLIICSNQDNFTTKYAKHAQPL